jgi:hypothetical protein
MTSIPPSARRVEPTFPDRFEVIPWADPLVDTVGFPPHHAYVELLWLPIIGPSATWLYRRLGHFVQHRPHGALIDLGELAASIGLGPDIRPMSRVQQSLRRVVYFGLATWDRRLAVRTTAPPLSRRHVDRLAPDLQAAHHSLTGAHPAARQEIIKLGVPQAHDLGRGSRWRRDQAPNTVTSVAYGGLIDGEHQAVERAAGPAVTGQTGTVGETPIHTDPLERATP